MIARRLDWAARWDLQPECVARGLRPKEQFCEAQLRRDRWVQDDIRALFQCRPRDLEDDVGQVRREEFYLHHPDLDTARLVLRNSKALSMT